MLDCIITIGGKEYSVTEFAYEVMEKGIGGVLTDPSTIDPEVLSKYEELKDTSDTEEDSIMEHWGKLEARKRGIKYKGTKEQVNELLYPSGQLTDYAVQETIRYNTYSGISLTGITANFGKMLGYLFETTPVIAIRDKDTGTVYNITDKELDAIFDTYKVNSIEQLLEVTTKYSPALRADVQLKKGNQFTIDKYLVDKFSRTEEKFYPNQKIANVFETIDTLINLAIDNVKEGKLHILGITGVNANAFLNLIGMGIPLVTVSKIFKSPNIEAMNNHGRMSEKVITEKLLEPALEKLTALSSASLRQALLDYGLSEADANTIPYKYDTPNELFKALKKSIFVSSTILDKVYVGKGSDVEIMQALSDIAVADMLIKLVPVNESMFEYAQIFGILRSFPNKKWKIDSIIAKIERHTSFKTEEIYKASALETFNSFLAERFKAESKEYQELVETNPEEAEELVKANLKEVKDNPILYGEFQRGIEAKFANRILRGVVSEEVFSTEVSPLENSSPLRLPHLRAAYRSLMMLKMMIERLFAVHSPTVRNFIGEILTEANIFSPFDSLEKAGDMQKAFIKYLSADLKLKIKIRHEEESKEEGGPKKVVLATKTIDTFVPHDLEYYAGGSVVYGIEAWAQDFIQRFVDADKLMEAEENKFLLAVEPSKITGSEFKTLRILSDKVNDEELLEEIRQDFLLFAEKNPELALDLFKYNLLVSGMFYEKTGFSLIFPDSWAASFSQALENRLETMIPFANPVTQYNLELVRDEFLFQFLRNNTNLISFPRGLKSIQTDTYKKTGARGERKVPFYGGVTEDINGNPIYFDLKVNKTFKPQEFLRQYNSDLYARIQTPDAENKFDYYVKLTENVQHEIYNINPHALEDSLDLTILRSGKHKLVNKSALKAKQNEYMTDNTADKLKPGHTILVYDKAGVGISTGRVYRIEDEGTSVNVGGIKRIIHKVSFVQNLDFSVKAKMKDMKTVARTFLDARLGSTYIKESLAEIQTIVRTRTDAVMLTNKPVDGVHVLLELPDWTTAPTAAEKDKVLKRLLRQVEKLDKTVNYYTTPDLLDALDSALSVKAKVAQALYKKIGYVSDAVNVEDTGSSLGTAVEASMKRSDYISIAFNSPKKLKLATELPYGTHYLDYNKLNGTQKKLLVPGSLAYFGNETYGYLHAIEEGKAIFSLFNEALFLSNINKNNYSHQEFEQLKLENINC